jgi:hypothetical protein
MGQAEPFGVRLLRPNSFDFLPLPVGWLGCPADLLPPRVFVDNPEEARVVGKPIFFFCDQLGADQDPVYVNRH